MTYALCVMIFLRDFFFTSFNHLTPCKDQFMISVIHCILKGSLFLLQKVCYIKTKKAFKLLGTWGTVKFIMVAKS